MLNNTLVRIHFSLNDDGCQCIKNLARFKLNRLNGGILRMVLLETQMRRQVRADLIMPKSEHDLQNLPPKNTGLIKNV